MIGFPRLYTDFAKYYDRLEAQYRDYEEETAWIGSVLRSKASARLIDLSCGTGRHVAGLRQSESRKPELIAMDASPEMVKIARERIGETGIITGDFLKIPFRSESFDSAICMYWSLAGLEHAQAKQLFREVSRILEPGGIFIFDVENAEGVKMNLIDDPFIDAFIADSDTGSRVVRVNLSKKIEEDVVDWRAFYLIEKEGIYELQNDRMKLRFYSKSTLESLLRDAGFDSISVTSSPGGTYVEKSPTLYLLARKKP